MGSFTTWFQCSLDPPRPRLIWELPTEDKDGKRKLFKRDMRVGGEVAPQQSYVNIQGPIEGQHKASQPPLDPI